MQTSKSRIQGSFMNPYSQSINKPEKTVIAQMRIVQAKAPQKDIEGQKDFQQGKEIIQVDVNINKTSKPQKKSLLNSFNHNFQKHTVVTIKRLTKSIDFSFGASKVEILAHQMWNVFLVSGIKSKQILAILFGAANLQDQNIRNCQKNVILDSFAALANRQYVLFRIFCVEEYVSYLLKKELNKISNTHETQEIGKHFFIILWNFSIFQNKAHYQSIVQIQRRLKRLFNVLKIPRLQLEKILEKDQQKNVA